MMFRKKKPETFHIGSTPDFILTDKDLTLGGRRKVRDFLDRKWAANGNGGIVFWGEFQLDCVASSIDMKVV